MESHQRSAKGMPEASQPLRSLQKTDSWHCSYHPGIFPTSPLPEWISWFLDFREPLLGFLPGEQHIQNKLLKNLGPGIFTSFDEEFARRITDQKPGRGHWATLAAFPGVLSGRKQDWKWSSTHMGTRFTNVPQRQPQIFWFYFSCLNFLLASFASLLR